MMAGEGGAGVFGRRGSLVKYPDPPLVLPVQRL